MTTPTPPTPPTENAPAQPQTTGQLADAAIAELVAKVNAPEASPPPATPTPPAAPSAPPAPDPMAAKSLAQIERREAELLRRQEAWRTEQAAELKELQAVRAAKASGKPSEILRAHGWDGKKLIDAAGSIYTEAVGEAAPKEMREQQMGMETRSEVARLQARIDAMEAEKAAAAKTAAEQADRYQRQEALAADVTKIPEDQTKHVRALLSASPDLVKAQLLQMAETHYATYGEYPTSAELAGKLEQNLVQMLKPFAALYAAPPVPPPQPAPPATPTPPAKTLSNTHATRTPPSSKLPDSPSARLEELLPKWSAGQPLD